MNTSALGLMLFLCALQVQAADIRLVGLSKTKALLSIDGSSPKFYEIGSQIKDQIRLVSVDTDSVVIDQAGKRQTLRLGAAPYNPASNKLAQYTAQTASNGHFIVEGRINNGKLVRMLVDTGATAISMSTKEAQLLGINYRLGRLGQSNTANGPVTIYLIMLKSVKVGDIELFNVEAAIHDAPLDVILLGMSFISRVDMMQTKTSLTFTQR
jgi:aspartyl protease family protein